MILRKKIKICYENVAYSFIYFIQIAERKMSLSIEIKEKLSIIIIREITYLLYDLRDVVAV